MELRVFTSENLKDYLARPGIVLVDFWAPWCAPCHRFTPIFAAAAERHPEVTFGQVNTDEQQDLARVLGITSIPTVMAFINGRQVFSQPGAMTGRKLDTLVTQVSELKIPTDSP